MREAAAPVLHAKKLLKSFSNRMGQDVIESDFGDRLTQTLRDAKSTLSALLA